MHEELFRSQTWLEEMVYHLLRWHGCRKPEDIRLTDICRTFRVEIWRTEGRSRTFPHPDQPGWHVIQVDSRHPLPVRREKIAHELGHLILHEGVQPQLPELLITLQEQQTTHFADHLLLPYYMFQDLIGQVDPYRAAPYLARRFRVTQPTARKRFDRFLSRVYRYDPYLLA